MLYVKYYDKPFDYYDLEHGKPESFKTHPTVIIENVTLTQKEYDELILNFFSHQEWCTKKGGIHCDVFQSIKVTAPERAALYINPNGSNRPLYVGIESYSDE